MTHNLDTYRSSRDRGTAWLLQQLNDDGSIGPVDRDFTYYRMPWTFTITGHTDAALRQCDWVRRNQFSDDGDFVGVSHRQVEANSYQNATFIYGADRGPSRQSGADDGRPGGGPGGGAMVAHDLGSATGPS
ncbi:MAG: hypothetical protein K0Q71_5616 [Thermomicrobiales bacterium]|nr:hypothetical protein [Thermomicrobiales bacterium]